MRNKNAYILVLIGISHYSLWMEKQKEKVYDSPAVNKDYSDQDPITLLEKSKIINSTFLIIHGASYIGSIITQLLIAYKAKVIVVDKCKNPVKIAHLLNSDRLEFFSLGKKIDTDIIDNIIINENPDFVIYTPDESFVSEFDNSGLSYVNALREFASLINVVTDNMFSVNPECDNKEESIKKFLLVSSFLAGPRIKIAPAEKFDIHADNLPEESRMFPYTKLGWFYNTCETYIRQAFANNFDKLSIVRPFNIYGKGDFSGAPNHVPISKYVKRVIKGKDIAIDKDSVLYLSYVEDLAFICTKLILGVGTEYCGTFDACTEDPQTENLFCEIIVKHLCNAKNTPPSGTKVILEDHIENNNEIVACPKKGEYYKNESKKLFTLLKFTPSDTIANLIMCSEYYKLAFNLVLPTQKIESQPNAVTIANSNEKNNNQQ